MAALRRLLLCVIGTLVTVQCQFYNGDYYPEESKFQKQKGDNYSPTYVEEVERPHYWIRLRDRSQRLLDQYRRRGYNPFRRQLRTYEGSYQNSPRRSNVQRSGWQTNTETRNYVKGPRTAPQNGAGVSEHYVYPQETVQETVRRYVDAKPNDVDRQDRRRKKKQRKRKNRTRNTTNYSDSSRNTIRRDNRQLYRAQTTQAPTTASSAKGYQGCKDTGMYCTFWKSIGCCEEDLGRKYCKRTCGFCSPHQMLCPSSFKYGCCYDGEEALDVYKSNCPDECKDKSRICQNPVVYRDCDPHSKNTLATRRLCPVTCGACFDFSRSA